VGCRKDGIIEETIPTISLTKPYDLAKVNLGDYLDIEGKVDNANNGFKIYYSISSPEANYNYLDSNNYDYFANEASFKHWITLDKMASVGKAKINVWVVDGDGNKSAVITRNISFIDPFDPIYVQIENSVSFSDSIIVKGFLNSNDIIDSMTVFNYTTSTILGYATDIGGLVKIEFNMNNFPTSTGITEYQFFSSTDLLFGFKISDSNTSLEQYLPFRVMINENKFYSTSVYAFNSPLFRFDVN
jgi:hypothetical protein